jgi:hypothetical protein
MLAGQSRGSRRKIAGTSTRVGVINVRQAPAGGRPAEPHRDRAGGVAAGGGGTGQRCRGQAAVHLAAHREHPSCGTRSPGGAYRTGLRPLPWHITGPGDVFAAGRWHNRSRAVGCLRRCAAARPGRGAPGPAGLLPRPGRARRPATTPGAVRASGKRSGSSPRRARMPPWPGRRRPRHRVHDSRGLGGAVRPLVPRPLDQGENP